MKVFKWALGGILGGVVGAAIWAVVAMATGREIGWIAWGVGVLVGMGVRYMAGEDDGFVPGGLAAILSVLAILGGKYAAVHFMVNKEVAAIRAQPIDDLAVTKTIAFQLAMSRDEKAPPLVWPAGKNLLTAETQNDFPPELWAEASGKWKSLKPEERENARKELTAARDQNIAEHVDEIRKEGMRQSFGPLDLLFFGLAIFTAFKIGSGLSSSS